MASRRDEVQRVLRQRVACGLHLGALQPGDRLASARATARELGTDYRVVVAAARDLERDRLVEVRPRAGIFAGARARLARPAGPEYSAGPQPSFEAGLVDLLLAEIARGTPVAAAMAAVRRSVEPVRLRAACLECNRDQLEFLCGELEAGYGFAAAAVELEPPGRPPSRLLRSADLLVSTSFHAHEAQRLATALGKPCILATLDPRQRTEVDRLLAERPVCLIGTDRRWAIKARAIWSGEPGAANLRPLTLGHDSLDAIPAEAGVLLMPAARRQLAGSPLLERALPPRGFSLATARQLVAFLVAANLGGGRPAGAHPRPA